MPETSPQAHHEIKILEERIAKLREAIASQEKEKVESPITDKELLHEAVGDRIRGAIPLPPSPVPIAPPVARSHETGDAKAQMIEPFIAIAFSQNIPVAVKAVMKSGNAHLIDALHDMLVDRFYEELVRLGKLK